MHGRPFPGEGYFPVTQVSEAIFATGFRGFTVMEVFEDDAFDPRKSLLAERANRAVGSWIRLAKELELAPCSSSSPSLGAVSYTDCPESLHSLPSYTSRPEQARNLHRQHRLLRALLPGGFVVSPHPRSHCLLTTGFRPSYRQALRVRCRRSPSHRPLRGRLPPLPLAAARRQQGQPLGGASSLH
jgi:hypothetical protein